MPSLFGGDISRADVDARSLTRNQQSCRDIERSRYEFLTRNVGGSLAGYRNLVISQSPHGRTGGFSRTILFRNGSGSSPSSKALTTKETALAQGARQSSFRERYEALPCPTPIAPAPVEPFTSALKRWHQSVSWIVFSAPFAMPLWRRGIRRGCRPTALSSVPYRQKINCCRAAVVARPVMLPTRTPSS